jgi:hypothetical protein
MGSVSSQMATPDDNLDVILSSWGCFHLMMSSELTYGVVIRVEIWVVSWCCQLGNVTWHCVLSSDVFIWCCHLVFYLVWPSDVVLCVVIWFVNWSCYLVLSAGVIIWCCHLVLSSGVVLWCCPLVLSSGVAIWCCHLVLPYSIVIWCCHLIFHPEIFASWGCHLGCHPGCRLELSS